MASYHFPDLVSGARNVVDEVHQIYEDLVRLPLTETGGEKAGGLQTRLNKLEGIAVGMRNSPDWEALSDVFFKQQHLLGRAISEKRGEVAQQLKQKAPQRLDELRAEADRLAEEYASKIASFDVGDDALDSVIVLRAKLIGESPLPWLTARQWVALAMKQDVASFIEVQATFEGLAIVLKDRGKPSVTYFLSLDYGELYVSAVRASDKFVSASNHQRRYEFETLLSRAVGYTRP